MTIQPAKWHMNVVFQELDSYTGYRYKHLHVWTGMSKRHVTWCVKYYVSSTDKRCYICNTCQQLFMQFLAHPHSISEKQSLHMC